MTEINDEIENEDFLLFYDGKLAKDFVEFCQQKEGPKKQQDWIKSIRQEELRSQRNALMERKEIINDSLATLGYHCNAVTKKEEESIQRYAYGLMSDNSFRDDILRAYYYFILGTYQHVPSTCEEVQAVLDGSENFADIDIIRKHVDTTFDKLRQTNQIPERFASVEVAYQCLSGQIASFKHNSTTQENDIIIERAIDFVLRQQFLNRACKPLVIVYLANPFAKEMKRIADLVIDQLTCPARMAEVLSIDSTGIDIRLKKGIKREEYIQVWNSIEPELHKPHSVRGTDILKSRFVFLKCLKKMSLGQISKTYYRDYYDRKNGGKEDADDLVRHAIKECNGIYLEI